MKTLVASLCVCLALAPAGCKRLAGPAVGKGNQLVAADKSCQVILPSGWHARAEGDRAVLRAGAPGETALFMVLRIPKEDLADKETLQNEGRIYMDELRENEVYEKLTVVSGPVSRTINGRPALQYEVDGVMKEGRTKFRYLINVVEGEKSFFRLVGTMLPSAMTKYGSGVEEITNSFTELP
jgi:hypothetical protein